MQRVSGRRFLAPFHEPSSREARISWRKSHAPRLPSRSFISLTTLPARPGVSATATSLPGPWTRRPRPFPLRAWDQPAERGSARPRLARFVVATAGEGAADDGAQVDVAQDDVGGQVDEVADRRRDLLGVELERGRFWDVEHRRRHRAGGDDVDADALRLHLGGERFGEAAEPGLRRGVGGLARLALVGGDRGEEEDAAARLELRRDAAGEEEGAGQVDRQRSFPGGDREGGDGG